MTAPNPFEAPATATAPAAPGPVAAAPAWQLAAEILGWSIPLGLLLVALGAPGRGGALGVATWITGRRHGRLSGELSRAVRLRAAACLVGVEIAFAALALGLLAAAGDARADAPLGWFVGFGGFFAVLQLAMVFVVLAWGSRVGARARAKASRPA